MKVSPPSMLALLLASSGAAVGFVSGKEEDHVENENNATTTPAITTSAAIEPVDVIYYAYFTDANCSQFAGIKAVIPNDSPILFTPARKDADEEDISCVDAMACLYMPYGPTCTALLGGGWQGEVAVNFTLDENDVLYECDPSNAAVGQPECEILNYSSCVPSSIYNCHWHVFTQNMLRDDPMALIHPTGIVGDVNDNTATSSAGTGLLENYVLLAYYDDNDCTTLVGMRGFVTNDSVSMRGFPGNEENYTCEQSMACFLNENGTACESMISTVRPADVLRVEDDGGMYLCRTNGTDPVCSVIEKDACVSSGFYPCRYHLMLADYFAKDPFSLAAPLADAAVAEVEEDPEPSNTTSAAVWSSAFSVRSMSVIVFAVLFSL
jgi:hypothetical protein